MITIATEVLLQQESSVAEKTVHSLLCVVVDVAEVEVERRLVEAKLHKQVLSLACPMMFKLLMRLR